MKCYANKSSEDINKSMRHITMNFQNNYVRDQYKDMQIKCKDIKCRNAHYNQRE